MFCGKTHHPKDAAMKAKAQPHIAVEVTVKIQALGMQAMVKSVVQAQIFF
ncbi:MAG: hypothetical protein RR244_04660 [Oscillospiraceae bacterium]